MNTVKTTRRSFFGWLGALVAMPFVGWKKTKWRHIAKTVDVPKGRTAAAWIRHQSFTINPDHPLAEGLVMFHDGKRGWKRVGGRFVAME